VIQKKKIQNLIRVASLLFKNMMMAHQRQDETKQPSPSPSNETTTTLTTTSDAYLSTHLIVPYFINAQGEIKRPEHLIAWWSRIFSFYVPDEKDRIPLRSLRRLFRGALKPPPRWTTFPHPNYPTLNELLDQLNEHCLILFGKSALHQERELKNYFYNKTNKTVKLQLFINGSKHICACDDVTTVFLKTRR